jgi:hypothetical protein
MYLLTIQGNIIPFLRFLLICLEKPAFRTANTRVLGAKNKASREFRKTIVLSNGMLSGQAL